MIQRSERLRRVLAVAALVGTLCACGGGEAPAPESSAAPSADAGDGQARTLGLAPQAEVPGPAVDGGALPNGGSVTGAIVVPQQTDTYTLTAGVGETVELSVAKTGGSLVPRLTIRGPTGALVGDVGGTTVASWAFVAATAGTYSVVIGDNHVPRDMTGTYRLHYVHAPGANEHGALVNGGSRSERIEVGDLDSYTFTANVGDAVELSLARTSGLLSPYMRIYDPKGSEVKRIGGTTVASTGFRAVTAGTYVVVVSDGHVERSVTGDYELHYVRAPGANELGPLVNGGSRIQAIGVGDLDSYTFTANIGDAVELSLARTSGELAPYLRIYDPQGSEVKRIGGTTVASTGFRAVTAGTYVVVVSDGHVERSVTGDYELHFVRAPGASEHGPLINGGAHGGVIDVGDLDSYTFIARVGETVTLSATGTSGDLSPYFRIYNPAGAEVRRAGGTIVASTSYKADRAGTYVVVLSDGHVEHSASGTYSLAFASDVKRFSYAALGDSYSSGEGLSPYLNTSDWYATVPGLFGLTGALGLDGGCHRSNRAYAYQIRLPGAAAPLVQSPGTAFDFFACTGAETKNIRPDGEALHGQPTQMQAGNAIDASRDLVTISIGGNDAQWTSIVLYCFAHEDCDALKPFAPHSSLTLGEIATPLAVAYAQVGIRDVHRLLRQATPNAATLVLGYPLLVSGNECAALQLPGTPQAYLSSGEQAFLRTANAALNAVIAASAAEAGLHYVPTAEHFADHETCDAAENWVNGFVPLNTAASFHPTARGQAEFAALINQYLQATAAGWPYGYLPNGLPRNPPPLAGAAKWDRAAALALQQTLPRFGALGIVPAAADPNCKGALGAIVPGESALIAGQGFQPGETVSLTLRVDSARLPLGTALADAAGALRATVGIPAQVRIGASGSAEALGAGPNGQGLLLMAIVRVEPSATADSDGDGIPDLCDNCSAHPNPDQRDTDRDGFGNACDADFNNDGIVNNLDLAIFKTEFRRSGDDLMSDLDGDYLVNALDLDIFRSLLGKPPGPAFTAPRGSAAAPALQAAIR
jgi:lysophospholipase L1-like esterase